MPKCFIFDMVEERDGRSDFSTVIVVEGPIVSSKDLKDPLDSHVANGNYARKPIIIGPESIRNELETVSIERQFLGLFAFGSRTDPRILTFDGDGRFFEKIGGQLCEVKPGKFLAAIRRQGITALVNQNNGVVDTAETFHYVKPSERHARKFIRAADIFRNSVELSFIAVWLLPHLRDADVVHCDTAAIFPVIEHAILLRLQLSEGPVNPIRLSSFQSYSNLEDYDFRDGGGILVVISASTSDGLREFLTKNCEVNPESILTLVGIGKFKRPEQLIGDATWDKKLNPKGNDLIQSWSAQKCPECQNRSLAIKIQGDSFLPNLPAEKQCLIKRTDVPDWLTRTLEFFRGSNVLSGFSVDQSGRSRNITFDLAAAFSSQETILPDVTPTTLGAKLGFILPAGASRIVVASGGGSRTLAETIRGRLETVAAGSPIEVLTILQLRAAEQSMAEWEGSIIVITGLATSPRELLAISRDLRRANKCPIVYIIGMASFPGPQAYKICADDLAQRFDGQRNQVHNLISIFLSPPLEALYSAWDKEKECLRTWQDFAQLRPDTVSFLKERLALLEHIK